MLKIFILPISIGIWILIMGITGYIAGGLFLVAIIVNTVYFIVICCYISKQTILTIWLIIFSIGFSLFIGTILECHLLDIKLDSFDIDGDTIFRGAEKTEEQQKIFKRVVNDSNVSFRYIIVFPYALIISIFGVTLFKIKEYILIRIKQKRN